MSDYVGYSQFDLSYTKRTMCNFGQLVPVMCDEVVPGDIFTIGAQLLVESAPTIDVVRHDVDIDVYYYYVPYRIVDRDFEKFIKGGLNGLEIGKIKTPKMLPTSKDYQRFASGTSYDKSWSLWLQLGFPETTENVINNMNTTFVDTYKKFLPVQYPSLAYHAIYFYFYSAHEFDNVYYDDVIDYLSQLGQNERGDLRVANWQNDYFTTALPYRHRGIAPSVGLKPSPLMSLVANVSNNYKLYSLEEPIPWNIHGLFLSGSGSGAAEYKMYDAMFRVKTSNEGIQPRPIDAMDIKGRPNYMNDDGSPAPAATFNIDEFREALILQQYMELNTRGVYFYSDFIRKNFGINSGDGRYNMPEYLGSAHTLLYFNEITNLAGGTGSQLGEKTTVARGASSDYIAKFRVPEYGLIMALLTIRPKTAYYGGINRQWLRDVNTDFYVPSFAHLPYQEIYQSELHFNVDHIETLDSPFGYQGHWDEMRYKQDMVTAIFRKARPSGDYHRTFTGEGPVLGREFKRVEVRNNNFVLQNECQFFVEYHNNIKAVRPLPAYSTPLEI